MAPIKIFFCSEFNQPFDHLQDNLCFSIQYISFARYSKFNQKIDSLPLFTLYPLVAILDLINHRSSSSLQSLSFGLDSGFNQPINHLPILLTTLELEGNRNLVHSQMEKLESKRKQIFELIKIIKKNSNNYLGKIQEIHNLFLILSYRDHLDDTGKIGIKLLEMYQEWNRS